MPSYLSPPSVPVAILYCEAFPSQELLHWVTAHVHAFSAFNGCPAIVVCDNLRSGVTRPHRYEPDVNATYSEMAAHYGVAIMPARSYKPRDKAKAEVGVLLAERWVMARLRDRHFTTLAEANAAIAELVGWLNARPFKRLAGVSPVGVRSCRPPGVAAATGPALRVRHLAPGQAGPGLPRRDKGRPPLLLGPLQPRRRGLGGPLFGRHGGGLLQVGPGGLPYPRLQARVYHRPCPHAFLPSPPRRLDAGAHSRLGGQNRPGHGQAWPRPCWPASPTPNRASARASASCA